MRLIPLLPLVLFFLFPASASAILYDVTVANPAEYTAVFRIDTTANSIAWLSGTDGPGTDGSGANTFWTPATPSLGTWGIVALALAVVAATLRSLARA